MKGSDFMFDYANRLFYNCHRMSFNLSGSYIDFREWIKKQKKQIYKIVMIKVFSTW